MPIDKMRKTTKVMETLSLSAHRIRNLCCGDLSMVLRCLRFLGVGLRETFFLVHPAAFLRSYARVRRIGDNGTITGTMCVTEGDGFAITDLS